RKASLLLLLCFSQAGVAVIELSVDSCPPGHTTQVGLRIEEAIKSGSVTVRGSQSSVASSASAELLPSPSSPEESSTTTGVLQLLLVDDVDAIIANDRSCSSLVPYIAHRGSLHPKLSDALCLPPYLLLAQHPFD
ncbi:hypothetical protein FOZ62_016041, partial [Perkinsus olseni]